MADTVFKIVRFIPNEDKEFGVTLRKRVNDYFKSNNISRYGDYRIWIKVIVMPALYLVPFGLLLGDVFSGNLFAFYALWMIMGIGMAGAGFGIMHDASHGALSKNQTVNKIISFVLDLAGGSAFNWNIQHNVLHHSFTNIDGYDEDIAPSGLMRFSPHQPVKPLFRFQAYYAWFLYGMMTFTWATYKDFISLWAYKKRGLLRAQNAKYGFKLVTLIIHKAIYYFCLLGLPFLLLDIDWWHIIIGWFAMHFVAGLILGCVFQPAHVIPETEFPLPDADNNVEGDFAKHQLLTTANFAPKNKILSWFVGGLNYQIEHHLFPNMCHVHHRAVSKIVQATAAEFNLPYHINRTFRKAVISHAKMLHKMRK